MNSEEIAILESEGFEVIEYDHYDPYFRTKTFVKYPNGRLVPHYDKLYQIPEVLNEGDEVTLSRTAVPQEIRGTENFEAALFERNTYTYEGELVATWILYAVFAIISIVLFALFIHLIQTIMAPCGTKPYEKKINDCWKVIIMPNCDYRSFNSCADPDGDGDPEGEWGEDEWQKGGTDYLKWMVYGVVAVGGVYALYLFSKIWAERRKEREYEPSPSGT